MPTLTEKYAHAFKEETQKLGDSLFANAKVSFSSASPDKVVAEVSGDPFCEATLEVDGNLLHLECECDAARSDIPCEHLWAAILAADRFGDLKNAQKRTVKKIPVFGDGRIPKTLQKEGKPPLKLESPSPTSNRSKDTRKSLENEFSSPYRHQTDEKSVPNGFFEPKTNSDTPQSTSIHPQYDSSGILDRKKKFDDTDRPNVKFFYVIDLDKSRRFDALNISVAWFQKKSSTYLPITFATGQIWPTIEDVRAIKALTPYFRPPKQLAYIANTQAPRNQFVIPFTQASHVLEVIMDTQRLLINTNDQIPQALEISRDSWIFDLTILDEGHGQIGFESVIHSATTTMPLSKTTLIIPPNIAIANHQLIKFNPNGAENHIANFAKKPSFLLEDFEAKQYVKNLIETSSLPLPSLPDRLQIKRETPSLKGKLFVRTAKYKYRGAEQLHAELSFRYGGEIVEEADERRRIVDTATGQFYERDLNEEARCRDWLETLEFRFNTNPQQEELGWKLHPQKLDEVVRILVEKDWEVTAEGKTYRKPVDKRLVVCSGLDWLEIKGGVTFGDEEVPLPLLMASVKKGEAHVKLDDGTYGLLPLEWLKNYTVLSEIGVAEQDMLKFKRSQVFLLDAFLRDKESVELSRDWVRLRDEFANFAGIKPTDEPEGFQGMLRPYQKLGLGWLLFLQQYGLGGCLADDMGLGKTAQVLALLQSRRQYNITKPSLVVVPKSLIFNWANEAEKFTPNLKVVIHTGSTRDKTCANFADAHIVLTTYGTLKQDIWILKDIPFDYCVLDEAQAIKNAETGTAKAAKALRTEYRLTMTGTPIENHLGELVSQFDFLNPGLFGAEPAQAKDRSKLHSQTHYGNGNKSTQASRFQKLVTSSDLSEGDLMALKAAVKPMLLRRTKQEVAKDLPPKAEQVLYCELDSWQRERYDELKLYYQKELLESETRIRDESKSQDSKQTKEIPVNKKKKREIDMLEALLRLRQAACHPGLIDEKYQFAPSAKLDELMENLTELFDEDHKALVFSQFTSLLRIVQRQLEDRKIKFVYLDGATRDRQGVVDQFQNDDSIKVFLISLKAGGVGLNLTAADYVFLLDPWWNPAVEAQAIDRAYRIGQERHVNAYRMIAKDTVEEKVLDMQNKKRNLADLVVNQDRLDIDKLSRDDLEYLLS